MCECKWGYACTHFRIPEFLSPIFSRSLPTKYHFQFSHWTLNVFCHLSCTHSPNPTLSFSSFFSFFLSYSSSAPLLLCIFLSRSRSTSTVMLPLKHSATSVTPLPVSQFPTFAPFCCPSPSPSLSPSLSLCISPPLSLSVSLPLSDRKSVV